MKAEGTLAFPRETDEQARRVVLDICQDHVRKVLESVRRVALMLDDFTTKTDPKMMEDHLLQIRKLKEEASELKRVLLQELAEAGMLLISREDLLRLVIKINEISDFSEGIAFRINYLTTEKIRVNDDLRNDMLSLAKNVLKAVTNLRKTIMSLMYSRAKAIDMAKSVEVAEYAVDELYRNLEMKIVNSEMDVGTKLILRDVAQLLEDIADKAEDATDSTRVLALSI